MYTVKGNVVISFEYEIDADSEDEAMDEVECLLGEDFNITDGSSYEIRYVKVKKGEE